MDRMSVFLAADNESGHVQAVIAEKDFQFFEKLGFVASVDELKLKWFTEFGHLNRGDMLTSEQHRCHNEKKKFQRRV